MFPTNSQEFSTFPKLKTSVPPARSPARARDPVFRKDFNGPIASDYTIHNDLIGDALIWSACGADVNLRTNSSMRISTKANAEAMASVDSEDVQAAIIYHLQWRSC